ncbi:MAG: type II toxin-antitoxin system VapC family toxin [Spirochaetales bacterium]|nr:type II toxin-antitoxin system VapC family toxin [Spirochaetales bacterium]
MTKKTVFDTNCFSSFLMIGREDIILTKYRGQIVIPQFVYDEYCRPVVYHLRVKIDQMLASNIISRMEIIHGTEESKLFRELTKTPRAGNKIIGKGEASAIVLAKFHGGVVVSNNLKDVKAYTQKLNLTLVTTSDILVASFTDSSIDETEANRIWADMLKMQRKLPAQSFSAFLRML